MTIFFHILNKRIYGNSSGPAQYKGSEEEGWMVKFIKLNGMQLNYALYIQLNVKALRLDWFESNNIVKMVLIH